MQTGPLMEICERVYFPVKSGIKKVSLLSTSPQPRTGNLVPQTYKMLAVGFPKMPDDAAFFRTYNYVFASSKITGISFSPLRKFGVTFR